MQKTAQQKKDIFAKWDLVDESTQLAIIEEYKREGKGNYNQNHFLNFIEAKMRNQTSPKKHSRHIE